MKLIDSEHINDIIKESQKKGFEDLNFSYCDLHNIPFFLLERPILTHPDNESYETPELDKVKILNLSNNFIETLESKVSKFSSVETLDISNNRLSILPRQLTEIGSLRILIASNNPICKLPDKVAALQSLQHLDLSSTGLYSLPINFKFLYQIKSIDISNCQFTVLPKDIVFMPSLERLEVKGNPLIDPPIEIASKGLEAIRKYYEEQEATDEKDFLYEVKLLLVGEERVGKSSLTKALSDPNYEFDLYEKSTEGINIKKWTIDSSKLKIGKDFQVNIWDFGGQEIYHATHQFFLTKRSIYFLVTEARKDLRHDDLFYWLNLIEVLGGQSPVLIIVNKSDQPHTFFATDAYKARFPNLLDLKNVSCLPEFDETLEGLKSEVYSILKNSKLMPDIGVELPKVWINIRNDLDVLRDEGLNFISTDRYFKICKKNGLNKERALFLGDYFHDLGVILHFRYDLLLRDTIFLNFEWVTKAVYCVLDNPLVISQNGLFSIEDLESIWNQYEYGEKKKELLALMKNDRFDVCFEISEGQYLAPQLLHPDKINLSWTTSNESIRYEYWYEFMPKGILSRLIVKCHQNVVDNSYYKYGVLLEKDDGKAFIEEKYFESPKKIVIEVQGNAGKELLALIRSSVDEINNNFNKLNVQEMIKCSCETCSRSANPSFFDKKELIERLKNKSYFIECGKPPYSKVSISEIANNVFADVYFKDVSSVPIDIENFEMKNLKSKLEKSEEKFEGSLQRLNEIRVIDVEIRSYRNEINKLQNQKNVLDSEAEKKARTLSALFVAMNFLITVTWSILIFTLGWDNMEKWTFLFGLALIFLNSLFFLFRKRSFQQNDLWINNLKNIRSNLYMKNKFSVEDLERRNSELKELESKHEQLLEVEAHNK